MVIMAGQQRRHVHLTHWGAAEIESDGRKLTSVRPWREDPAPSRILENLAAAHRHPARVGQPYIRQGWLEHGPGGPVSPCPEPAAPVPELPGRLRPLGE